MEDKHPISVKAKPVNKAKAEYGSERKKIGLDDQGQMDKCDSTLKYKG